MLKKTGIVAAAIAASLLAVTPLAFAGGKDPSDSHSKKDKDSDDDKSKADDDSDDDGDDADDDDDDDSDDNDSDDDDDEDSDDDDSDDTTTVTTDNQANDCDFSQNTATQSTNDNFAFGLLGALNAPLANVVAPVSAQLPILNCNNIDVSDLVDVDSNNSDETTTVTDVDNSGNG